MKRSIFGLFAALFFLYGGQVQAQAHSLALLLFPDLADRYTAEDLYNIAAFGERLGPEFYEVVATDDMGGDRHFVPIGKIVGKTSTFVFFGVINSRNPNPNMDVAMHCFNNKSGATEIGGREYYLCSVNEGSRATIGYSKYDNVVAFQNVEFDPLDLNQKAIKGKSRMLRFTIGKKGLERLSEETW